MKNDPLSMGPKMYVFTFYQPAERTQNKQTIPGIISEYFIPFSIMFVNSPKPKRSLNSACCTKNQQSTCTSYYTLHRIIRGLHKEAKLPV